MCAVEPAVLLERAWTDDVTPDPGGRVWVIAAGKAAPAMATFAVRRLGSSLGGGVMVTSSAAARVEELQTWVGGHPLPDEGSERAGREALEMARRAKPCDRLLVLLSGGASAMLATPAAGVTLEEKRRTVQTLLLAGADIHALNTVRKHLSVLKGGRLAAEAGCACRTLAISDVVGDDLSVIASGPTVPDHTTFDDALDTLRRFGGLEAFPPAVVARLTQGAARLAEETPKPGDPRLTASGAAVVGGRHHAMDGAATEARRRGYAIVVQDEPVVGDARQAASRYARRLADVRPGGGPLCVVSSGETTVHVTGRGRGGRNQEFALALVDALAAFPAPAACASIGTDGIDGPTDAAGAIVDQTTAGRARQAGLSVSRSLSDNDAYGFFDPLGDLFRTGATGTNVGDLQVLILSPQ